MHVCVCVSVFVCPNTDLNGEEKRFKHNSLKENEIKENKSCFSTCWLVPPTEMIDSCLCLLCPSWLGCWGSVCTAKNTTPDDLRGALRFSSVCWRRKTSTSGGKRQCFTPLISWLIDCCCCTLHMEGNWFRFYETLTDWLHVVIDRRKFCVEGTRCSVFQHQATRGYGCVFVWFQGFRAHVGFHGFLWVRQWITEQQCHIEKQMLLQMLKPRCSRAKVVCLSDHWTGPS